MTTMRWSKLGVENLGHKLSPRDREIVEMVEDLRLVTGNQIMRVFWGEASSADQRAGRRTLARLVQWRVIARLERRVGGLGRGSESWTYALDVAGQRLVAARSGARRPRLPRPAMWRHCLAGTEAYTLLVENLKDGKRSLGQWQGEPACWRRLPGEIGQELLLKPDAFVVVQGPGYSDLFFIEIDTGSQSRTVIRAKLEAYRRYAASGVEQSTQQGVFPQVVFITTNEDRVELLQDVIGRSQSVAARAMFAVCHLSDVPRLLLPDDPP
jgi:hypothetical protein